MRLPEIELDDRRFQDLVSEARTRISRACPEWTEHNVSDPGITLIELFAWMTEMTIYRLNRVPDKLHVALLDLLGIRLDGPSAATDEPALPARGRADGADPDRGRRDRGRHAAHGQRRVGDLPGRRGLHDPADAARRLRAPARRPGQGRRRRRRRGAPAGRRPARRSARRRRSATRSTSASRSRSDRLIMQIDVDASQARGAGVNPEDPPLRWEVSQADGQWARGARARGPHRRLQLRLRHGRARAAAALGRRSRSAGTACTGCAAGSTETTRSGARRRDLLARAGDLRDHRRPDGRAAAAPRTPRASSARSSASATARPARSSRCATSRCSSSGPARRSRSRTPSPATGRAGSRATDFVGSTEFDRHFVLDLVSRRGRARPGDPRDRRRLDPVRRGPAQGRACCASRATATAAGATAT